MKYLKYIIIIIILSGLKLYSQAENPELINNYFKINEHNKPLMEAGIRKCTVVRKMPAGEDTIAIYLFNEYGKLQQKFTMPLTFEQNSGGFESYFYLYDSYGKLIQRIDSTGKGNFKNILEYDDLGSVINETVKGASETVSESSYDYDAMGRLVESVKKDRVLNCKTTEKYVYNTYNDMVKLSSKSNCGDSDDGNTGITYNYKYNDKGAIIEKITIINGNPKTEIFSYDDKGRITEKYESSAAEVYERYIYTYDEAKFITNIEINETSSGEPKKLFKTIVSDMYGNVIDEIYKDKNKKEIYRITSIYEYNKQSKGD